MASLTGVGDSVELLVPQRGDTVDIDISGTYDMTILFQREKGSKGSGAWETLNTYNTVNATVAAKHTTDSFNENLRLIVDVDTSGTAVATLADNTDKLVNELVDDVGNKYWEVDQKSIKFNKSVRAPDPVVITASTTLNAADHAGRTVVANAAAGLTVTMPAATGTGDVYRIFFGTTVTTNNYIVQAASASDVFLGGVSISTDIAGVTLLTAATTDTITMNGTTTGGLLGSWVELVDVAAGQFQLSGFLKSSGVEATPFSAAV